MKNHRTASTTFSAAIVLSSAAIVACSSPSDGAAPWPSDRPSPAANGHWAIRGLRPDGTEQRFVVPAVELASHAKASRTAQLAVGERLETVPPVSASQDIIDPLSGEGTTAYQLVRAAATQCGIREVAAITAWSNASTSGGVRYIFDSPGPDVQPGCNSLLQNMQVELCIAGKLHEAATSATGTDWSVDLSLLHNIPIRIPPQRLGGGKPFRDRRAVAKARPHADSSRLYTYTRGWVRSAGTNRQEKVGEIDE